MYAKCVIRNKSEKNLAFNFFFSANDVRMTHLPRMKLKANNDGNDNGNNSRKHNGSNNNVILKGIAQVNNAIPSDLFSNSAY